MPRSTLDGPLLKKERIAPAANHGRSLLAPTPLILCLRLHYELSLESRLCNSSRRPEVLFLFSIPQCPPPLLRITPSITSAHLLTPIRPATAAHCHPTPYHGNHSHFSFDHRLPYTSPLLSPDSFALLLFLACLLHPFTGPLKKESDRTLKRPPFRLIIPVRKRFTSPVILYALSATSGISPRRPL